MDRRVEKEGPLSIHVRGLPAEALYDEAIAFSKCVCTG